MSEQTLGLILICMGLFIFSWSVTGILLRAFVKRNTKIARLRIEMESGAIEYGNMPYTDKGHLMFIIAHLTRAKYRREKDGDRIKVVADSVKEITIVHENWPSLEKGAE